MIELLDVIKKSPKRDPHTRAVIGHECIKSFLGIDVNIHQGMANFFVNSL
jgi:hypothetical protein